MTAGCLLAMLGKPCVFLCQAQDQQRVRVGLVNIAKATAYDDLMPDKAFGDVQPTEELIQSSIQNDDLGLPMQQASKLNTPN